MAIDLTSPSVDSDAFPMTVGDRLPILAATLTDDDGVALDLSAGTVVFRMVSVTDDSVAKVDDAAVTEVDMEEGQVAYEWEAVDVDTEGTFAYWFIYEDGDGRLRHFPNGDSIKLVTFSRNYPT